MPLDQTTLQARFRAQRREEFRAAILEAAQTVFADSGFRAARMENIARVAGVATGTLYNYFDSKAEVFSALMARSRDELFARLAAIGDETVGVQRLRALVRESFTTVDEWGQLFSLQMEAMGIDGAIDVEAHKRAYGEFLGLLQGAIEDAVSCGELREDIPSAELARALAGICRAFMLDRFTGTHTAPLVQRTDVALQLFLEGGMQR